MRTSNSQHRKPNRECPNRPCLCNKKAYGNAQAGMLQAQPVTRGACARSSGLSGSSIVSPTTPQLVSSARVGQQTQPGASRTPLVGSPVLRSGASGRCVCVLDPLSKQDTICWWASEVDVLTRACGNEVVAAPDRAINAVDAGCRKPFTHHKRGMAPAVPQRCPAKRLRRSYGVAPAGPR